MNRRKTNDDKIKCPYCGALWDGVSTNYYDGREHEDIPKAVCYKCGRFY